MKSRRYTDPLDYLEDLLGSVSGHVKLMKEIQAMISASEQRLLDAVDTLNTKMSSELANLRDYVSELTSADSADDDAKFDAAANKVNATIDSLTAAVEQLKPATDASKQAASTGNDSQAGGA